MAAKLFSLYLLVIAGFEIVRAGAHLSFRCPSHWPTDRTVGSPSDPPEQASLASCERSMQRHRDECRVGTAADELLARADCRADAGWVRRQSTPLFI
jgi:hypothetical protein